ncbi:8-amino-7-oxononanoate synthase [Aspergillus udagawae]|nr:8-amino-7-oxononanoate synthase [Aspergillus udagawae]
MFFKSLLSVPIRRSSFACQNRSNYFTNGGPALKTLSTQPQTRSQATLTRRLQATLENRRQQGRLIEPAAPEKIAQMVDFGSNDTLSLNSSGVLRKAFFEELAKHPKFDVGSRSTRIFEGTTQYLSDVESHIAQFHRAESALFFPSGYEANVAIWSTIPQPGDVVIYDEYIHASIHDGMRQGRAITMMFSHNDCNSLRKRLIEVREKYPALAHGDQTVFIALESFYSMDADLAPVHEILKLTKEILPHGNTVFSIDEAHSNGLVGQNGSGYVCHYGLEKEFAIRLHTCGKGLGSTGAAVLVNPTVRFYLINYSRGMIFSTAPAFPTLAAVKAGYTILASNEGEDRRIRLQNNIRRFHEGLTNHPEWPKFTQAGILRLPTEQTWGDGCFSAPIIPIITSVGQSAGLAEKLQEAGYWVNPVRYPIVPRDKERVRIVVHADNTDEQIDEVVDLIMIWAREYVRDSGTFQKSDDLCENMAFSD